MPMYLVATYDTERTYGGPEEGGWYYDRGKLVHVVKRFATEGEANDYCRQMNAGFREYKSNYRAQVHIGNAPRFSPSSRPHYE